VVRIARKRELKRPLCKPEQRRKNNINIDLKGIWYVDLGRINMDHDRDHFRAFVNTVMNLRVPLKAGNFLANWATVRFSTTLLHGNKWN
jgi:hypothetical protein